MVRHCDCQANFSSRSYRQWSSVRRAVHHAVPRVHAALRPTPMSRHGQRSTFVSSNLNTTVHVFIRHDAVRRSLQPPYDGRIQWFPGQIVCCRQNKGKDKSVSIDRLKPAFMAPRRKCSACEYSEVSKD